MASGDFRMSRTVERMISGQLSILPSEVCDQSSLAMRSPVEPNPEIEAVYDDTTEYSPQQAALATATSQSLNRKMEQGEAKKTED
jgi:hypothetical protein